MSVKTTLAMTVSSAKTLTETGCKSKPISEPAKHPLITKLVAYATVRKRWYE